MSPQGERPSPDYAIQFRKLKELDMKLDVAAIIVLPFSVVIALAFVVLAIRYLPLLAHVAILSALASRKHISISFAVAVLVLLPVFRWIRIAFLVLVLIGLTLYYLSRNPLSLLELLAWAEMTSILRDPVGPPNDCVEYFSSMSKMANRNSLCTTKKKFIGLLPVRTKPGDLVVIALGCDALLVVRRTQRQSYYSLVGDCYLHGIMDGEMAPHFNRAVNIALC